MSKQAKQAETFEEYVQEIRKEIKVEKFYKNLMGSGEDGSVKSDRRDSVSERRNYPRDYLAERKR